MTIDYPQRNDLVKRSESLMKALEYINSITSETLSKELQELRQLSTSINDDINFAWSQEELNSVLFYLSKAKSSSLVLREIIVLKNSQSDIQDLLGCLTKTNELIETLNNYIHLCRINITIEFRKKKK